MSSRAVSGRVLITATLARVRPDPIASRFRVAADTFMGLLRRPEMASKQVV
jgi:hypothetical protein